MAAALMDKFNNHRLKGPSRRKWDALAVHGDVICDLFQPMKTAYNSPPNSIPPSNYSGRDLNKFLKDNPDIGALINLCIVEYYNKYAVAAAGVEYHHLPSYSYDEVIPDRKARDQFVKLVNDIRSRMPGKKIVVHCSHGCNRTCYMIATYLIDEMEMQPLDAIRLFAEKRSPGPYHVQGIEGFFVDNSGQLTDDHQRFLKEITEKTRGTVFYEP